ncbi:MAG: hypothetical protein HOE53_04540 [Candidatus Magasanikbacteria bacterium]|jgi:DEAD/DEAH box helicase domain-containing protein|nr:hypothetical protein [Candidatus Magasanikbacteria bacterium]
MQGEIVFDIETYGDIRNMSTMEVTVVSLYDYDTASYYSFDEHQLSSMWPFFEKATRLIGYNSIHFDVPILNKYYTGDLAAIPHLDMLKVIKETMGKRFKLDDVAKATLQISKSADGLQAMEWYKEGKIDQIKEYCEQDVKVTMELYEYGLKNKMLYYPTITGEIMPFSVDFSAFESAGGAGVPGSPSAGGINMTLPF